MKYIKKSRDFQRSFDLWCWAVVLGLLAPITVRAQEMPWPEPSKVPEQFLGATVQSDVYERYYDPFGSLTLYGMDRRASGAVLAKCAVGQRGSMRGSQVEGEWYPVLGQGAYGYVGYALGLDAPFPRHRGGVEYFAALPASFEGSAGLRVYVFRDRRTVTLVTGSAAKYLDNFWLSIRPYLSVNLPRKAFSFTATGRYYLGERDEFVFIRAGAGLTPDERSTLTTSGLPATEVFSLHSYAIGGGGQWYVWPGWLLNLEGMVGRQELGFQRGTYVWNPSAIFGIRYSIR